MIKRQLLTTQWEVAAWISKYQLGSADNQISIRDDLTIDVVGSVTFRAHPNSMEFLPVNFGDVSENFCCDEMGLQTLLGCPQKIGGYFSVILNGLKDIDGFPREIGGTITLHGNHLTSLQGLPSVCHAELNVSCNPLKTLQYAPTEVRGDFSCEMTQLESLRYAPKKVDGMFDFSGNKVTSFDYLPNELHSTLDCSYNPISSFESFKVKMGSEFELYCLGTNLPGVAENTKPGELYILSKAQVGEHLKILEEQRDLSKNLYRPPHAQSSSFKI